MHVPVSIQDLPLELLFQIIEDYLFLTRYNPIIGLDAWWLPPYKLARQQPGLPNLELLDCLPCGEPVEDEQYKSSLKALRLVNKEFKFLVEPYLFSEMNLLYDWSPLRTEKLLKYLVGPHWQHIQVIHAYVDESKPLYIRGWNLVPRHPNTHAQNLAEILTKCHNLRALGIYYNSYRSDFTPIIPAIVSLLENGRLSSLGIYSPAVVGGSWSIRVLNPGKVGPMELIGGIGASERASEALKKLDIATEWMPKEIYELLVSSRFSNLDSLTVRYSFRHDILHGPVSEQAQRNQWSPSANLVRLQLINCQTAYAPDVPRIVRQFENLKELFISMCGYRGDIITAPQQPGWSRLPGALCRNRRPLHLFTIEHMDEWEIRELGTIPTTILVCANVNRGHLIRVLESDAEIFPGLEVVKVLPEKRMVLLANNYDLDAASGEEGVTEEAEDEKITEMKKRLDAVCSKRRVELKRDAQRTVDCYCCSY